MIGFDGCSAIELFGLQVVVRVRSFEASVEKVQLFDPTRLHSLTPNLTARH